MQNVRSIIQFLQRGFSGRKISRDLNISRNTIKIYVNRLNASGFNLDQLLHMNDEDLGRIVYADARQLQPDPRRDGFTSRVQYFLAELKRTGVTQQLLWEEYKKENPDGYEYSQFCELFVRHRKVNEATMHFRHSAADLMMVDFAGEPLHYVNRATGEIVTCPVFVAILPCSGYSFVIALSDAKQPNVIKALTSSLQFFGGVPMNIKFDNMKTAVSKSSRYEPVFTETLQQWSIHNNITLLAARVRKPKDKAPVENQVKLSYQRIYAPSRNRIFFSLDELNEDISQQLSLYHHRSFQRKDYSRLESFTSNEKKLLQELPAETYVIRHVARAKVQKNYHITLGENWHHYSVPFSLIGKTVNAIYDTDTVEIYFEHKRIALHKRNYKSHDFTTIKEHMPESHQRYSEQRGWTPEYFLEQAAIVGPCTRLYIQNVLKAKRFTEQTYNACLGIMRLVRAYTPVRVEAACKRALTGECYSYTTINNILINNLDTLDPAQPALFMMPKHNNVRGPGAYN